MRTLAVLAVAVLMVLSASCGGPRATPIVVPARTKGPTPSPTARPTKTPTPLPTEIPTKRPTPEGLPVEASLGDGWTRPEDGMVMVFVPSGTFQMGVDESEPFAQDDESPPHPVALSGFWIDRTEVNNSQFARCVAAGACQAPFKPSLERHKDYYGNAVYDDYPVINVNWGHGHDYCAWAGAALPTEAQWEYAARGPENFTYPWGKYPPDATLLNYDKNLDDPAPVGSYPKGASWCGALDMAGNVYEWVADWYGSYPSEAQKDPVGAAKGIGHVLRGGSWHDGQAFVRSANRYVIREAYRDYTAPTGHGFNIGFRCIVAP